MSQKGNKLAVVNITEFVDYSHILSRIQQASKFVGKIVLCAGKKKLAPDFLFAMQCKKKPE